MKCDFMDKDSSVKKRFCRLCGDQCYGHVCRSCYESDTGGHPSRVRNRRRYYRKHGK